MPHFKKILIANRSEIAVRVIRGCKALGIPTVAVYSDADKNSVHRLAADESVYIGEATPSQSYLNIDKIIDAAKQSGADAIHPGYGFLSENATFAKRCEQEKITFIGPSSEAIRLLGNKVESRVAMAKAGIPLIPGMKTNSDKLDDYVKAADEAGYPVLIKAAAGGGGKGMRVVQKREQLTDAIEAAKREAKNAFGDDSVYLEKYLVNPRHIEFQILADTHGNAMHLFERECSIQRRHQKIIEETPSVALTGELRAKMGADAVKVAKAANYTNAGTVEFLLDESGHYYFLEVNTRLQVEHPITEEVTGVDLVAEQIRIAAGEPISKAALNAKQTGHAIECRLYAEDGENNFLPSTGKILFYAEPGGDGVRVDSGIGQGSEITIHYDPIMAKLIVHAADRDTAIEKMIRALHEYNVLGVRNAKRFMVDCLSHPEFKAGRTYTNFIERNLSDRSNGNPDFTAIAAAIAAVASEIRKSGSQASGRRRILSPWQTIGRWEIGGSIG